MGQSVKRLITQESNYRPQPAGISDVTLDQGLEKLVEVMAENVRKVWGQE